MKALKICWCHYLVHITSLLLILLFIYASLSKLNDLEQFIAQLQQSPLLFSLASYVAVGIPILEVLLAILLVFDKTRLLALYGSYFLMLLFTFYIVTITQFSEFIPCSCGGVLQNMSWKQHMIFNLFFVGITLLSILLYDDSITNE